MRLRSSTAYVYGFTLSEHALPINRRDTVAEVAGSMMEHFPVDEYPYLLEFTMQHVMQPGYDFGKEFKIGLHLILDGLGRLLNTG